MKRNLSYKLISILMAIMVCGVIRIPVDATDCVYNWYCVHRKDHKQPQADSQISFVEKYNGIYIDKAHGDDCAEKVLYLTFDAGYENGNVEKTLDVLKEEGVKGAFFVLGNLIEKNNDLIVRMFDEGHLVCNHTYSHKNMVGKSKSDIASELENLEETCFEKTGRKLTKFYRPPEGKFDEASMRYVDELGYKTVFWSFAYADWDNNKQMTPESAKKKILDNIHNGEIMLLHPTSSTNAQILGEIIQELKQQGYRFGTLDELCKE